MACVNLKFVCLKLHVRSRASISRYVNSMYKPIDIRFAYIVYIYILVPLDYLEVAIIGKHRPFFLQFRLYSA